MSRSLGTRAVLLWHKLATGTSVDSGLATCTMRNAERAVRMRQGGRDTEPAFPHAIQLISWSACKAIGGAQSASTTTLHGARCARNARPGDQENGDADTAGVTIENTARTATGAASRGEWSTTSAHAQTRTQERTRSQKERPSRLSRLSFIQDRPHHAHGSSRHQIQCRQGSQPIGSDQPYQGIQNPGGRSRRRHESRNVSDTNPARRTASQGIYTTSRKQHTTAFGDGMRGRKHESPGQERRAVPERPRALPRSWEHGERYFSQGIKAQYRREMRDYVRGQLSRK